MERRRAPEGCSNYPSHQRVREIARSLFRLRGAQCDAEGNGLEDFEQELHVKACELVFQNKKVDLPYVYQALWNHGRNMRKHAYRVDRRRYHGDIPEVSYCLGPRLESRACVRLLESALSADQMATLVFSAMDHKSGDARRVFKVSYQGWHNRLNRARERARAALEEVQDHE